MKLKKLEIYNLWKKDKINIEFNEDITFLTGFNGSGKSTILNILFDTLNQNKDIKDISKDRFWGASAIFNNKHKISKAYFPNNEKISNLIQKQKNLFSLESIKKIEKEYEKLNSNKQYNYYSNQEDNIFAYYDANCEFMPFIYQEDRPSLHNIKNSKIDFNSVYWQKYGTKIDERLFHIRNVFQLHEANINKNNKNLLNDFFYSNERLDIKKLEKIGDEIKKKAQPIENIIDLLNQYFKPLNKEISKDDEDKIQLSFIESGKQIKWYNLSRGEKTLIYLILTVFLYKEKIKIFLFDEIEISLHIEWQERLVKDLITIAPDCQFVIATHSPSLLENGWIDKAKTLNILR